MSNMLRPEQDPKIVEALTLIRDDPKLLQQIHDVAAAGAMSMEQVAGAVAQFAATYAYTSLTETPA
jgi:hypothetical protein